MVKENRDLLKLEHVVAQRCRNMTMSICCRRRPQYLRDSQSTLIQLAAIISLSHLLGHQFIHTYPSVVGPHTFFFSKSTYYYLFCLQHSHILFDLYAVILFHPCGMSLKSFCFYLICPEYLRCHCCGALYINLHVYFMQFERDLYTVCTIELHLHKLVFQFITAKYIFPAG